jgi:hypothetical protein
MATEMKPAACPKCLQDLEVWVAEVSDRHTDQYLLTIPVAGFCYPCYLSVKFNPDGSIERFHRIGESSK